MSCSKVNVNPLSKQSCPLRRKCEADNRCKTSEFGIENKCCCTPPQNDNRVFYIIDDGNVIEDLEEFSLVKLSAYGSPPIKDGDQIVIIGVGNDLGKVIQIFIGTNGTLNQIFPPQI